LKSKQELEQMMTVVDEADTQEIEENLEFINANVQGLTAEREQLKGNIQCVNWARCPLAWSSFL